MQTAKDYLHIFLDMGDALLNSGAEIFRVEDTLNRMGYACGATHMNVFVITSSIVITMEFPGDGARTQTRRIHEGGGNDFTKLEQLNDLSRRFCSRPVSAGELRKEFERINAEKPKPFWKLLGSVLAASSFALFYGGTISDAIAAGIAGILIWGLQKYLRPVCMNEVTFQFVASFLTGCAICGFALLCPFLHMDKIMIGDIMLLIPGLMSTNAIRDVLRDHPSDRRFAPCCGAGPWIYGRYYSVWEAGTLTTTVIQLITGAIGSVAFGLLFHMKTKYLSLAAAGGFFSWLVFLFGKGLWGNVFLPALLAGFIVDVYAEILARVCKETSTSFFVTSVIPLIPGSTLYYCMSSIVEGNTIQALEYGRDTFLFAFGIAAGMSIAWAICYFLRSVKGR